MSHLGGNDSWQESKLWVVPVVTFLFPDSSSEESSLTRWSGRGLYVNFLKLGMKFDILKLGCWNIFLVANTEYLSVIGEEASVGKARSFWPIKDIRKSSRAKANVKNNALVALIFAISVGYSWIEVSQILLEISQSNYLFDKWQLKRASSNARNPFPISGRSSRWKLPSLTIHHELTCDRSTRSWPNPNIWCSTVPPPHEEVMKFPKPWLIDLSNSFCDDKKLGDFLIISSAILVSCLMGRKFGGLLNSKAFLEKKCV